MLLVFDLDFTLWDCDGVWCDCTCPPYKKYNGYVMDSSNRQIRLYPDVLKILDYFHEKEIKMALASRTSEPGWALDILNIFGLEGFFHYKEIYPASKTRHFSQLQKSTGIKYSDMYFFDDEYRNIEEVSGLGVNCLHVKRGIEYKPVLDFIQNGR